MKKYLFLSIIITSFLLGAYGISWGTHDSCHVYRNDSFLACYYDWFFGGRTDSNLTRSDTLAISSGPFGSYLVNLESIFVIHGGPFFHESYINSGERCARSRFWGSEWYWCRDGVYVLGAFRGKVNFKPGQYRFHVFHNDGVRLFVQPHGYIIDDINYDQLGKQSDSAVYTMPGGYADVAVFYNFKTPTFEFKPWPGEQPRLQLWWENLNEPLQVSLTAEPSSNGAPLFGVSLTADASGNTALPTPFTYTFYCNRSDSGTDVTSPYDAQFTTTDEMRTAQNLCTYEEPGLYTAKVILQRGEEPAAEARAQIMVSESLEPTPIDEMDGDGTGVGTDGDGTATGTPREVRP